jgi:type VI secretion system protein ImpL
MTQSNKLWVIPLTVLLSFPAIAWALGSGFGLAGRGLYLFQGGAAGLGVIAAGVVHWILRKKAASKPAAAVAGPAGDVDAILTAAQAQLARAKVTKNPSLAALPTVIIAGPEGSAKTTAIVRNGINPELLAGEVYRGETVAPTRGVNVWYGRNVAFVEASGAVTGEAAAWTRLARALRPRSLGAALTGKAQPSRYAVVCFGCEEFFKPGAGEAVPAAARTLRARLGELANQFGVRLPVYVLFTKADAIPHFEAFVRNLSADEAREVLGASVEPDSGNAGTYAERVTPQLEQLLNDLYRSLSSRRLDMLAREHAPEWKPGAYEFPREFRKLVPTAVEFLRELCKPSELAVSPVLRGFYFVGVQAVHVPDGAGEFAPMQAAETVGAGRSATSVFSAAQMAASRQAPAAPSRMRKVPRWDFLERVFPEVVLADDTAARLTQGGARVSFVRRALLAGAGAVALVLAIAFAASFTNNRRLQAETRAAAAGVAGLPAYQVELPTVDALQRLDSLRAQYVRLADYERNGPPLRYRWGLYSGSSMYPAVRRLYFTALDRTMFGSTRSVMRSELRSLPDAPRPTDDYGDTYNLLKAYLITTSNPEKTTADFLTPVLMQHWLVDRDIDSVRSDLAGRQFDTYANELRHGNPYLLTADAGTVDRTRAFLRQFAGSERIYQFMIAEADKANPSILFNQTLPGSAAYVVDPYEVTGAYTQAGWTFMDNALKTVDRFLSGEPWVMGEGTAMAPADKAKLVAELRARYATDYVDHWRRFLQAASVQRYGGLRDASDRLRVLSGNQSPLLALFSLVSRNTNVGGAEVKDIFQPVQALTPPAVTDKLIGATNAPYVTALVALQSSVEQAAAARGPAGEGAAAQAVQNASSALVAARQIAAEFKIDPAGQVHTTVQRLMEAPITYVEPLLRSFGASQVNARGASFCAVARPVLAKFPFNPSAGAEATPQEVAQLLRPGTGALWAFYNEALQPLLQKQGATYVPQGGGTRLTTGFVNFFNKLATLSEAMFKDTPEPRLQFNVEPQLTAGVQAVTFTVDGEPVRSSRNRESRRFTWPGSGRESKLTVQVGPGAELVIAGPHQGSWGFLRTFYEADPGQSVGTAHRAEWTRAKSGGTLPPGARIAVDVSAGPVTSMFRRSYFAGTFCPGTMAQ